MKKDMTYRNIQRLKAEISDDIYDGLIVADGVVGGSITLGRTRQPLWNIAPEVIIHGWKEANENWELETNYNFKQGDLTNFIRDLLDQRGEFSRLLLVLAAANALTDDTSWWQDADLVDKVQDQLDRCKGALQRQKLTVEEWNKLETGFE